MAVRKKPAPKKKTKTPRKAAGGSVPDMPMMEEDDSDLVQIPDEPAPKPEGDNVIVNAETGAVTIEHDDGTITVDPLGQTLWQPEEDGDPSHEENLALKIDPLERARIAEELITAIEADKQDRSQWEQMRAKCIELLGIKLEDPKGDVSRSALGMSTSVVRDPTMLQAVNMFRANTYGELCPSSGPVKVKVASPQESKTTQDLAQALQDDLNAYLTTTASEYYPDMYYMLWWTGLTSGTFKKVYTCPLRNRPVSESIDGTKLILSDSTDIKNAPRITHEVEMDRATMRAMQLAGVYRDIALVDPLPAQTNIVDQKKATISGMAAQPQRIEDQKYTLYESYCKIDIKGHEHKIKGKPTGLPLPYRVTIDTTSREVLEIRRNWDEEDDGKIYLPPQIPFVAFPFSTGLLRTYGTGLGHEMGNMASALTALLRISIDNGMLGNYPGVVKAKGPGRDLTNEIMVPPGGCVEIDTGGAPIQTFMMPLPYKDVSGNVMGLIEQTRGAAKELGGTANLPVAEGRQDAPVGTTLAMIEQALKPLSATHRMLCAAQSEEFRLLVKLFRADPEALWRDNKRPRLGKDQAERLAKFKQALEDCDIEPVADPNVPSEMHRKLMAMALKQLTMGNPAYDPIKVDRYIASTVFKMPATDFDQFLAPPQQPGPSPEQLLAQIESQKIAVAQQKVQVDAKKIEVQAQEAAAKRQSQQETDALKIAAQFHTANGKGQPQPKGMDPYQMAQLGLKQQQVNLQQAKLEVDTHLKQREMDSKEAVEAFKIVSTAGIHPEAVGVMQEQMGVLSPFIEQAASDRGGSANGGPVEAEESEEARSLKLAAELTKILSEMNSPRYKH